MGLGIRRRWRSGRLRDLFERAARAYLGWSTPGYVDRHRAPDAPLRGDLEALDQLFEGSVANLRHILGAVSAEIRWPAPWVYNRWFESVDAELYYGMVRAHRPSLIVEVGSGYSTRFALRALRRNGRGRIVSLDPEPRAPLPPLVRHLRVRVEDAGSRPFRELGPGDILFIDSSHRTDEARFHVREILPALGPGVLCHHHDIPFPWGIYPGDDPEGAGEADVVLDFYRRHPEDFEIVVGAAFVRYRDPALLRRLVPSFRWSRGRIPTSLWTRRR